MAAIPRCSVRALQLLDSAEGCIPSDAPEVATLAFIRLRIALDLHDAGMAETQVLAAARCNGADTAVLEASYEAYQSIVLSTAIIMIRVNYLFPFTGDVSGGCQCRAAGSGNQGLGKAS